MASLGIHLLVRAKEYDVIHVQQTLYPAFTSVLIGKGFFQKPEVVKYACSGITNDINQLKRFPLGSLQLNYLVKPMDFLVALTQDGAIEFKVEGYPESRIVQITNGVSAPLERTNGYHQVHWLLTTARLNKQNGIDILLRA